MNQPFFFCIVVVVVTFFQYLVLVFVRVDVVVAVVAGCVYYILYKFYDYDF
jgi:hypothetical protein